ncbi:Gfo/Idh/MocA family protein [Desulforhopalus sp. IMCC35007]|uniref:Gfo/Idh/MocA family protein n=1 Tax=Desulforhopalus sp. IMCC35007 TaxID=2569543 RepID=UPI001F0E316B|nr:Gfo/Idh/MocA family oxidoreductase [Desulforhopalus sp. IMCC35007]
MVERAIRFGVAGPGSIGHSHCQAIQEASGAELVAVLGRDTEKTKGFAFTYGIMPYTDLDQFLTAARLDALTIATPSGAHLEIAVKAAQRGIHVLCEKPIETTSTKSSAMIKACREAGVQLGVFFQARFDPCTILAKQAIEDGRLGKILLASCQMRWARDQAYYDSAPWRGTWELDGGGCLMNQGIHSIDLLLHLAGDALAVSAFQGPLTHQRIEVEDNLCATVRFANGAIGTIETSTSCNPGLPRRVEISGEKGTICIEDNRIVRWQFAETLPEDTEIRRRYTAASDSAGGASDPKAIGLSGHRQVVEDFVTSIQTATAPCVSGEEGKRSVDFICSVYESMRQGGLVVNIPRRS